MLLAYYYPGGRRRHAELQLHTIVDGRRASIEAVAVSGARDARQIAAERGATPHNF